MDIEQPTILAVDDDALILMNTVELLKELGYNVLEACSGEAALLLAKDHHIDLLVTDQSMPNMTGLELISKLRNDGRDIPMILATGYLELATETYPPIVLLSKPYTPEELETRLREALESIAS